MYRDKSRPQTMAMAREAAGITARVGEVATQPRRFAALHSRNFALLWFGQVVSNSGSWMQIVAQGWLVYDLTRSPFYLGLVGFARAIPMIALPPMGGVVADRVPRLQLLKVTQILSLVLALILAVLTTMGLVHVWHIILLSFLAGAVNAFDQPTRQALLPDLVSREELTSAIALNSAAWQGSALFGPALAGATASVIGIAGAFYANAVSFLAVVIALFLMQGVPERSAGARRRRGLFDDLAEGLRYVRATPLLWTLLLLSAITSIFGRSYVQLLPAFARDVLREDTSGLGFMMSAPGAGTLVGATLLGALSDVRHKGLVLFVGMLAFSATLVLFTVSRSIMSTLGFLFLTGVTSIVFSTMLTTMLQLSAPTHMRGRVMSLLTVTFQGFGPLGALLTGALATAIGTPEAIALSAVLVAVVALAAAVGAPVVRDFATAEEASEA